MTPEAGRWLAAILREGGQGQAARPAPLSAVREACEWATRRRLGPVLYVGGCPDPDGVLRGAYLANLRRAETWLRTGVRFLDAIEAAGIPCLPMRGPFAGLRWYGDSAARCFSDLDVLAAPEQADDALRRAGELGWRLRPPGMPKAFYRALHLHYPLFKADQRVFLDLHGALDHPFSTLRSPRVGAILEGSTVRRVGGYSWRTLEPRGEVALACAHLIKEMAVGDEKRGVGALRPEHLPLYCDVVRMARTVGFRPNDQDMLQAAERWQLDGPCRFVGALMDEMERDEEGVWMQRLAASGSGVEPAHHDLAERVLGCRRIRLYDAGRYLSRGAAMPGEGVLHRAVRAVLAAIFLARAAVVAGGCILVRRMRLAMGAVTG